MKAGSMWVLVFAMIWMTGCHKPERQPDDSSLIGHWKLTETLKDPGDGSGKWKPVENPDQSFIEFTTDKRIQTNLFKDITTYKIVNSYELEFTSIDRTKRTCRYILYKSSLIMNPPCAEACGLRFVKVHEE